MSTKDDISGIYDSSPESITDFVEELIWQNTQNIKHGHRKLAGMLIGSPGIGKTESVEVYPVNSLERFNNRIVEKYDIKGFKFSYEIDRENSIEKQSIDQLNNTALPDDMKKRILSEIKKTPFVATVVVSQSDIIVPEDISGLPSSESDSAKNKALLELTLVMIESANTDLMTLDAKKKEIENTLKSNKDDVKLKNELSSINAKISKLEAKISDLYFFKDEIEQTALNLLTHVFKADDLSVGKIDLRSTTKFDFTEWEKKVWDQITSIDSNIEHVILCLDDITRSANNNPGILNVLMPILQQGRVGQRDLPAPCTVIITSNEAESETGATNYVMDLDEAQQDRLFAKKIKFRFDDWDRHADRNLVHDSVRLFFRYNTKYMIEHHITPRRATQLGQALYNKFGHDQTFVSPDSENNTEFMKTMYCQLGDSRNKNYHIIMNAFIAFLRTISNDTLTFITKLMNDGWSDETKATIQKFKDSGETVKISIIVHKVREKVSKEHMTDKQLNAVIDFFNDDLIPINLRFTMIESNNKMLQIYHKLQEGSADRDSKKLYDQLFKVAAATSKSIGAERKKITKMAEERLKK